MTDEEIKIAKEKYKDLEDRKNELELIKNRLSELKENELVKEYLSLSRIIRVGGKILLTDDYLVEKSFGDIAMNTSCENDIYVYMGDASYDYLFTVGSYKVGIKRRVLYKNLETMELVDILLSKKDDFESQHKIVYLKSDSQSQYDKSFEEVRNEFLRDLLTTPQEEAVKKFVMKYNSKE